MAASDAGPAPGRRLPRVDLSGRPYWLAKRIDAARQLSDLLGLSGDIERMAYDGKIASEIVKALDTRIAPVKELAELNGDSQRMAALEFVRDVRTSLDVPSQEDRESFRKARQKYLSLGGLVLGVAPDVPAAEVGERAAAAAAAAFQAAPGTKPAVLARESVEKDSTLGASGMPTNCGDWPADEPDTVRTEVHRQMLEVSGASERHRLPSPRDRMRSVPIHFWRW